PSLFSFFFFHVSPTHRILPSFPTRRSSDLPDVRDDVEPRRTGVHLVPHSPGSVKYASHPCPLPATAGRGFFLPTIARVTDDERRSEEHTSELQSLRHLVCRLLLEKKKKEFSGIDLYADLGVRGSAGLRSGC